MPIVPLKCPNCGGQLEIDSEKDAAICKYCGQPFIVKDAIVNTYAQNVTVNANQVNITNQKDFDIQGGVLVKYLGEDRNVIIPNNVVEIGESAFTESCIESIVIPDSVKKIKSNYEEYHGAFSECQYLKKVVLPDSVIEIGERAFYFCNALEEVTLSKNLVTIGRKAFAYCKSLKRINIPDKVNAINQNTFEDCSNLEAVHLPPHITIKQNAFNGCGNLSEINISDDSIVDLSSFDHCEKLNNYWRSKRLCERCGAPVKGLFKECIRCHRRNYF